MWFLPTGVFGRLDQAALCGCHPLDVCLLVCQLSARSDNKIIDLLAATFPCRRKLSAYREAAQRQERQQKLAALAEKMAYEKQVMGKGRKRKLQLSDGTQPPAFLWKKERKR